MAINKTTGYMAAALVVMVVLYAMTLRGYISAQYEVKRNAQNYESELIGTVRQMNDSIAFYKSIPKTITEQEFQAYYNQLYTRLAKDLDLRKISQVSEINTVTTHNVTTHIRDSVVNDTTKVRTWNFTMPSLNCTGIELPDGTLHVRYTHRLNVLVAISKKPREGFWNKVLLRPLVRGDEVTVIPSDTNTLIEKINVLRIKD